MPIQAVIFDLDGTLVDSLRDLAESVNYALKQVSLPAHSVESYKLRVGDGAVKMISRSLPESQQNLAARVLDIQQAYYREHICDYSQPYPGIPEALGELRRRSIRLAVLSNKPDPLTQMLVERLFGGNTFELVRGHRPEFAHKPDPGSALALAEAMNISPSQIAFVGDTAMDIQTAQNAGMIPIAVTWGFRDRGELSQAGAKRFAETPADLLELIPGRPV